jgi:hypothetical protein
MYPIKSFEQNLIKGAQILISKIKKEHNFCVPFGLIWYQYLIFLTHHSF